MADTDNRGKLRRLMGDGAFMIFGNNFTTIISLFINIILVEKLSVSSFGVYSILFSISMFGTGLLSFGAVPIITRYLPEAIARKNRRGGLRLTIFGSLVHLISGLIIVLFCYLNSEWVATHQHIDPEVFRDLLPFFSLFVVLKFEAAVFEQILMSHRSHMMRNLGTAIFQLLKLGLYWFFLPHDGSVQQVFFFLAISNLFLLFIFGARILSLSLKIPGGEDAPLDLRRIARYGALRYTTQVSGTALESYIDVIFVGYFLDEVQAGLYGFATRLVWMLGMAIPAQSLVSVIVPAYIAEYTRNRDVSQLTRVFSFYNKVVTTFLAPVMVGSIMLIGPIITVVFRKPEYLESISAFNIYFVGMGIFFFFNSCSFLLSILEKPEITFYGRIFIIYNLAMDWILIPRLGINGAAIATGSAMAFSYIFVYLMLKRVIPVKIPWLSTLRTLLYCGIMGLGIWPLIDWIGNVGQLAAVVLLGATIYGLLAWRLPVFSKEERVRLNSALGRPLFPL
ncbi:MAG: hypothetical protein GY835_15505 [bacterium]|nr:hypothetical protein [bacterium]